METNAIINKLNILGIDYVNYGWAIVTKRNGLVGFIDIKTGTVTGEIYADYKINDYFFYGVLPNPDKYRAYDKGQFYIRGIKDRQFKRIQYLDASFGAGDFKVAAIGTTKLQGREYLVNYAGKKLLIAENPFSYGAPRISMNRDGTYEVKYCTYDSELNKL